MQNTTAYQSQSMTLSRFFAEDAPEFNPDLTSEQYTTAKHRLETAWESLFYPLPDGCAANPNRFRRILAAFAASSQWRKQNALAQLFQLSFENENSRTTSMQNQDGIGYQAAILPERRSARVFARAAEGAESADE